jgi:competence protein ComGC
MTTAQKQMVGVAVASLVLGILGLILIGPLGSIPAVICGHVAKSRIKNNPDMLTGDGMALAGLILGYVQIGFMVIMIPLLAAIAIPSFVKARDTAQSNACINNMRMLDSAKEQAAMVHNYRDGATVPENEVSEYLKNGFSGLVCPKGGRYTINPLGQDPACSEHGTLSEATNRR